MRTHKLKTHPNAFQAVKRGDKKAEFRLNDRDFQLGDELELQEFEPSSQTFTGDSLTVLVTHIQTGYGIPTDYVMLSII